MLITVRGLALLLLATPLIIAAAWIPALLWLAAAIILLALILFAIDWYLARPVSFIEVQRRHNNRLSLGAENKVTLTLSTRHTRPLAFTLRDEPPWQFEVSELMLEGRLAPGESWEGSYTVRPLRRGDYRFGAINIRWEGPLGLVLRQGELPAEKDVKVYPDLLGVRRYSLLLQRNQLQEMGLRQSRLVGQGTEFERLREYRPDDDYRRINWKATARRWRPITVAYQTERSQNIMVVLDTGRMMQSPVGRMAKLDYAINATLLLSYVAVGVGDKVGLLTFAQDVQHYVAPRQGRGQFYRILDQLYAVEAQPVEPDYHKGLGYLAHKQRRRALIILFTDITGGYSMELLVQHVRLLARQSLPLVVTIRDPEIHEMARRYPVDTAGMYERVAAGQLLRERLTVLERLRRRGVETLDTPANQLSLDVISRYLDLKRRGRI